MVVSRAQTAIALEHASNREWLSSNLSQGMKWLSFPLPHPSLPESGGCPKNFLDISANYSGIPRCKDTALSIQIVFGKDSVSVISQPDGAIASSNPSNTPLSQPSAFLP
ncbi:hypothetical protein [Phormidium sp. CCY1219]|uniref:hypothetical protein n=1 Tax=Phormidium sp. CCY1219 TaxID=2886104 RepID=UPI002D1F854B|nr:hypothetical protein [Phormidium sp. CCY1219]MEB3831231.1 hypothetical protein [Phormidium sp. CCY1219]